MEKSLENFKIRRNIVATLAAMHFFGDPSKRMKIVGVTGTNGKTTTTTLLYRIAKELGYRAGLVGTVENIIDGEVLPTTFTTPEPPTLYRLLNKMADRGCEYVFMEVSSHGLDQRRVAGIKFAGGVFTNLTHDHMDYHKTFEHYFRAKKKLFKMLPKTSFALSNGDDPYGPKMLEGMKARKFLYGFDYEPSPRVRAESFASPLPGSGLKGEDTEGDFKGEIKKIGFEGLSLSFNGETINSKLLGKFNAYNLLSVWGACKLLGFDMEKVRKILEDIQPPRGRFEHFASRGGVLAVVDYAHTPDALENILLAVKEVSQSGRIIAVFGCGGDRDPSKRKTMGKIGTTLSDIAIFTSDNPRSEDPEKIIEAMKENLSDDEKKKVITIPNRREAIKEAAKLAKKGDIIVCAGKGHETYQEIKGVKNHFDDMEELKEAFSKNNF